MTLSVIAVTFLCHMWILRPDNLLSSQDVAGRPFLRPSVPLLCFHGAPRGADGGGQGPRPLLPLPAGAKWSQEDPTDTSLQDRHQVKMQALEMRDQVQVIYL